METLRSFHKGNIIIEEGKRDTSAYIILTGSVKITKKIKDKEVEIATLSEGQVFGEMGLIEDRPRSATVSALTDLTVKIINRDQFNTLLSTNPSTLIPIIKSLFERLRQASEMLARVEADSSAESDKGNNVNLIMEGQTAEAGKVLNDRKLLVTKFPFLVGRYSPDESDSDVFHNNDLVIEEEKPYVVSRNHFAILKERGFFWAVDRGSAFGIIVNGREIGGKSGESRAILDKGENQIIIGPATSKFIFLFKIVEE